MENYRLWYVRDEAGVRGPFPEPLICRFIVLGRLHQHNEVSMDGIYWRQAGDVPELGRELQKLLEGHAAAGDAEWSEERAKAILRWLDDRKSLDPRGSHAADAGMPAPDARSGSERRHAAETVEQHVYREGRSEFEHRLHHYRQRYGKTVAWLLLVVLAVVIPLLLFVEPVNPVKVGLQMGTVDCAALPAPSVRWSGCRKDGALLEGADLRAAELVGTSLRQAQLSHADLSRANLLHADLAGADLRGARLGDAVWVDGRICAADSIGRCR